MLRRTMLALFIIALALPLAARDEAAKAAAPAAGLRAELLASLDDAGKKVIELAGAMPQEKLSWRPGEGVRSVSEVFMHIAGGNYFLPTFVGVQAPAGLGPEMEKETDKAKILAALEKSYEHARQAIAGVPEAELDQKVKLFGNREATKRETLLLIVNHSHEHLGQAIAYARMNGVVPPWTARQSAGG